jgi:MinD-like ATPase involved in chromosome partitioning or flagellar assembly
MFKTGIIMIISTFSGSKGGVGKTTLAISLAVVSAFQRVPTLLVDASFEGGATSYLLGSSVEPPYLSQLEGSDVRQALRRVRLGTGEDVELVVAVNFRSPFRDIEWVARAIRSLDTFPVTIIDLPALTDPYVFERYLPLIYASDAILIVAEPNEASLQSALYNFEGKKMVVALNCPRGYASVHINDVRAKYLDPFARKYRARYVIIPFSPAMCMLSSERLNFLDYAEPQFVSAVTELARLLFSKK